ncbi:hypothetical protein [Actinacidiphila oryziradicis]|uniref:Uncharacterized protein n=1 Tax=Actinacidiphila oryziradicis TaxID=2571141 RepID=A0A4U0RIB9_9ACTN|nr:hypothetical protein [Actinacidiphila oryziradicis]TJZ94460.1 hypothetical protein FCI23_53645 [Actinacidiphila oryziradicis]
MLAQLRGIRLLSEGVGDVLGRALEDGERVLADPRFGPLLDLLADLPGPQRSVCPGRHSEHGPIALREHLTGHHVDHRRDGRGRIARIRIPDTRRLEPQHGTAA